MSKVGRGQTRVCCFCHHACIQPSCTLPYAALLQRIEAQEKERAKELPRAEELDAKSQPLDQLLSRIYGGITSQRVDVAPRGVQQVPGQHVGGPSARTGVLRPEGHANPDAGHSQQVGLGSLRYLVVLMLGFACDFPLGIKGFCPSPARLTWL
jgi:hypothetical protein